MDGKIKSFNRISLKQYIPLNFVLTLSILSSSIGYIYYTSKGKLNSNNVSSVPMYALKF